MKKPVATSVNRSRRSYSGLLTVPCRKDIIFS